MIKRSGLRYQIFCVVLFLSFWVKKTLYFIIIIIIIIGKEKNIYNVINRY